MRGGRDEGPDRGERCDETSILDSLGNSPVEKVAPRVREDREIPPPFADRRLPLTGNEKREEPEDGAHCDDEEKRQAQRLQMGACPSDKTARKRHIATDPKVYSRTDCLRRARECVSVVRPPAAAAGVNPSAACSSGCSAPAEERCRIRRRTAPRPSRASRLPRGNSSARRGPPPPSRPTPRARCVFWRCRLR